MAKKKLSYSWGLLILCWMAYTCSVIGKVNYSANIIQVESFFNVSHAEAGLVGTFYFFSYGTGQILNGFLCKKYNLKYVVFVGLLGAGLCNLAVGLTTNFELIKVLWLFNGIFLSVLWPCLIRLLSECLSRRKMSRASTVISTTTATGTFLIYALSALFVSIADFRFAFYTAAIVLPAVAFTWLFSFEKLSKGAKAEAEAEEEKEDIPVRANEQPGKTKLSAEIWGTIILFALFAVATNLVKDGLHTWVPSILKESFGFSPSLSIILTLVLPVIGIFGNLIAQSLYKWVKSFVGVDGLIFFAIGVGLLGVIGALTFGWAVVVLIGFGIASCLSSSSNSTITSIFPLYMKGKINSGLIAGILNGCCYVGSALSSYVLGAVADASGWNAVFYLLVSVCAVVCVMALTFTIIVKSKKKKEQ